MTCLLFNLSLTNPGRLFTPYTYSMLMVYTLIINLTGFCSLYFSVPFVFLKPLEKETAIDADKEYFLDYIDKTI